MPYFRLLLLPLAFLLACGGTKAPLDAAPQTGALQDSGLGLRERLDRYLRQRATEGYSGVVLVAKDGEVVLREAYSRDRSLTPGTAFCIGSVSKTLTAAAILRLRDEGRLSLSDPLSRFFANVPDDKRGITVRHLLTHTAGLGDHYAADGVVDRDEAVRALLARRLERTPGTAYGYTADAYNLLALVVEVASGQSFEGYLRAAVFRPAGMAQTGFWGEPDPPAPQAPARQIAEPLPNWGWRGPTGISSTVDDLYRWHMSLLTDSVLSASTRAEAFSAQVERPKGGAYGHGWQVQRTPRGTTLLAHSGAEDGLQHNSALYRYVEDGVVVIALSNSPEDDAFGTLRGVLGLVFSR